MLRKKTAAYALLSIYEIAQQTEGMIESPGVRACDVAERYNLPKAYVAKILSQLANAGVLHSDRGPRGGFRLNRPIETISLYDVFDSVGALVSKGSRSLMVKGLPSAVNSAMNRASAEALEALRELFNRTTLADILNRHAVAV